MPHGLARIHGARLSQCGAQKFHSSHHSRDPALQDFLTRPIQSSTSHPSQYEIAAAPVHPTTSSHAQGGQSGASITSAPSTSADTASIMTSTSDGAESALAHTHAAFSQLRTSGGDPLEEDVAPPNARLADWRAWSKVEARIVVHPDGTLRKQNGKPRTVRKDTIREEWSIEGVVWVTHVSVQVGQNNHDDI